MNPNGTPGESDAGRDWLANALEGTEGRALERYLRQVEKKLNAGEVDEALALSAALPRICSMLEHPQLRTSPAHCICWCDAWVTLDGEEHSQNVFPVTRPGDARLARSVSGSLLDAARNWYRQRGAFDLTVQQNLGKMSAWSAF
jgi:hypothetical protein